MTARARRRRSPRARTRCLRRRRPAGTLTAIVCDDSNSAGNVGTRTATFQVAAGENVKCVFTNTKRGTIIVEKQTVPDGAAGSFAFTGDAAGSIGDGGQITVGNLVPGTYTSTEAVQQGWALTLVTCNDANSTGSVPAATATFRLEPARPSSAPSRTRSSGWARSASRRRRTRPRSRAGRPGHLQRHDHQPVGGADRRDERGRRQVRRPRRRRRQGLHRRADQPGTRPEQVGFSFVGNVTGPAGTVHVNTVRRPAATRRATRSRRRTTRAWRSPRG